jgi:hypothetical protein
MQRTDAGEREKLPVEPPNFLANHDLPSVSCRQALTSKLGPVYGRGESNSKHNDACGPGISEPLA